MNGDNWYLAKIVPVIVAGSYSNDSGYDLLAGTCIIATVILMSF